MRATYVIYIFPVATLKKKKTTDEINNILQPSIAKISFQHKTNITNYQWDNLRALLFGFFFFFWVGSLRILVHILYSQNILVQTSHIANAQ